LSDDFSRNKFGSQWAFYDPAANEQQRARYEEGSLKVKGKGAQPHDCSPLTFLVPDTAYRVMVEIEIEPETQAGLLLFYNRRLYCGLGFDTRGLIMHRYGLERRSAPPQGFDGRRLRLRLENDRHIVTIHTSTDGRVWTKFGTQMEVSGYHHNVAGDFLSLRPALYSAGKGEASFRNLRYEAL
jgi:beta-xylosidase